MDRRLAVLLLAVAALFATSFPAAAAGGPAEPPAGSGSGRRIVYAKSAQQVWLVEEDGTVAANFLVSGRLSLPQPGEYRVFSKSRYTRSVTGLRMEYMVRFARPRALAIGFHSIPVDRRGRPIQREADLGTPRSAGCVRLRLADAAAIWDWAPVGTRVVVVR